MFPLGTVLFPHAVLPLHVFEPRYRVMMRRCIDGDREFGVVLIERGSEVGGGDTRFDIGTVARIVQAAELEDGRFAIAAVGLGRFRVVRWLDEDPYPRAEVDLLEEGSPLPGAAAARDRVFAAFAGVLELWHVLDDRVPTAVPPASSDATRDLFEVAATAPLGPLDAQRVLEATAESRAVVLEQLLADLVEELRGRIDFE
jgi:Lon protease-like protein